MKHTRTIHGNILKIPLWFPLVVALTDGKMGTEVVEMVLISGGFIVPVGVPVVIYHVVQPAFQSRGIKPLFADVFFLQSQHKRCCYLAESCRRSS